MEPFRKTIYVGNFKIYGDKYGNTFVNVKWNGRNLSLDGVEGPFNNGNCAGSSGQISKPIDLMRGQLGGLTAHQIDRLWEIWERWHLNDMRAGCEHQRANPFYNPKEIVVSIYNLHPEILMDQKAKREEVLSRLMNGEEVVLTTEEKNLLRERPLTIKCPEGEAPEGYVLRKTEKELNVWAYPTEHLEGVLMRPCEECGYKYGSSWLHEEVPEEVLQELQNFPEGDVKIPKAWA